jgi:hypothetical protein
LPPTPEQADNRQMEPLPRLILLRGGRDDKPDGEKPVETKEPEIIYRADYRSLWCPPPPLPPRRLPIVRLIVLAGVVLGAVVFAVGD